MVVCIAPVGDRIVSHDGSGHGARWVVSVFAGRPGMMTRMDGRTDGRIDGRTDGQSEIDRDADEDAEVAEGVNGTRNGAADAASRSRLVRFGAIGAVAIVVVVAGYLLGTWFASDPSGPPENLQLDLVASTDWSTGVRVARDQHDGVTAELVVAVAGESGRCVGIRSSGAGEPAALRCSRDGFLNAWEDPTSSPRTLSEHFGFLDEVPIRRGEGWSVALAGAVSPRVVRVTAQFGDGAQYSFVTRNDGGWFVAVLPDVVADPAADTGRLVNPPVALELFDVEGTRITIIDLTVPPEIL